MEIRKADSKGRVTGFEPGRYYLLEQSENGDVTARLVTTWPEFVDRKEGMIN
ncbi:hypothetical protein SEA_WATERT_10 [Microbacterium phage WaterT]|nr:hypothetical protein SEA_WATERT_10 [Microbacterium phage WaterT]